MLFERRCSNGAVLNRHGLEKSNVGLEESSGSRFEEPNVGLKVVSNRHEFNSRAG